MVYDMRAYTSFRIMTLSEPGQSLYDESPSQAHVSVCFQKEKVLSFDMVDKSTSPLQTHFGPVFCDEAVQTDLLFPA
jgi:hypothetical protein